MVFRKIAARPVPVANLGEITFATSRPHRHLAATWRRGEGTGRPKLVWKLINVQNNRGAA